MKVAFHLRRLPASEPATALLVPGEDVRPLFALCARLAMPSLPRIYAIKDGFLLKLGEPTTSAYPGTLRLRSLAEDLLIPANAELVPALLDDEAQGLVQQRGLIFLPDGRVLAYSPHDPVPVSDLVAVGQAERGSWQSLPAARPWPARIRQITLSVPEPPPEELLEAGGQDIGTEEPRPEDSSLGSKILGQGSILAGKGMMGLGNLLHWRKLTELGNRLIKDALAKAPRLGEQLFGRQEAALLWLLNQFREGNIEKALRRALPLVGQGVRGRTVAGGFRLPFHNLLYSLANILGSRGGITGIWGGGAEVQSALMLEYRKAAEQAAARGDYRRAAFIYGKLLRDFRAAANVLHQGGLYHDAAILYLMCVGDKLAAAKSLAAAGEIDRAVELYREAGQHIEAGDLLLQAGEEEAALVEYQIAALEHISQRQDYLAAGDLMLSRAKRPDLASSYFTSGWEQRPARNDLTCALRLACIHATDGAAQKLRALVSQAEAYFLPPGKEQEAGHFFTRIVWLAEEAPLAVIRDDLRDQALGVLATKLRQHAAVAARPGNLVSDLLGQSGAWDAALVNDAAFALKAALQPAAGHPEAAGKDAYLSRTQIAEGLVTSACYAPVTGAVMIGFESGSVYCFRPSLNEVERLPGTHLGCVSSLATDQAAHMVVALRDFGPGKLTSYVLTGEHYRVEGEEECRSANACLAPLINTSARVRELGIWSEATISLRRGPMLVHLGDFGPPMEGMDLGSVLLLPCQGGPESWAAILVFCPNYIWYSAESPSGIFQGLARSWRHGKLGWTPCIPEASSLKSVPISWFQSNSRDLELAGLSVHGTLHWSRLDVRTEGADAGRDLGEVKVLAHGSSVRAEGYLAATVIRSGQIAGVSRSHIDWLRADSQGLTRWYTTQMNLRTAIACFPITRTRELVVVCRDGVVVRVPMPV
jgi:hypothetical protein